MMKQVVTKMTITSLPKKQAPTAPAGGRPSVFGSADDSDEELERDEGEGKAPRTCTDVARLQVNRELNKRQQVTATRTDANVERAMEEDPEIFNFDDFLEKKTAEEQKMARIIKEQKKEARYITGMQKAAEDRKLESDIFHIAKMKRENEEIEQEAQGNVPQEKFITSAWKKKLDEIHEHVEAQKVKDAEDDRRAVTKRDFGKSLLKFRSSLLDASHSLNDDEQKAAEEAREEMQNDYYSMLNKGIKKQVLKEAVVPPQVKSEADEEKKFLQTLSGLQPSSTASPESSAAVTVKTEGADSATSSSSATEPPGTGAPTNGEEESASAPADNAAVAEDITGLGPSAAMLKYQAKLEETFEQKLDRKRKRWARRNDDEAIAEARERFLERMQETLELLRNG